MLAENTRAVFTYPDDFKMYPDHRKHSGQTVTVLRPLCPDEADGPDVDEGFEQMYRIRADDGWEGEVFESELQGVA